MFTLLPAAVDRSSSPRSALRRSLGRDDDEYHFARFYPTHDFKDDGLLGRIADNVCGSIRPANVALADPVGGEQPSETGIEAAFTSPIVAHGTPRTGRARRWGAS